MNERWFDRHFPELILACGAFWVGYLLAVVTW